MASSCNLGTINAKISPLDCGTRRANGILGINSLSTLTAKKPLKISGLKIISTRPWKVLNPCSATSLETLAVASSEVDGEESKSSGSTSELIPNFDEVESLLTTMCDTTSIAEVELKVSGFRLHMTRNLDPKVSAAPPPIVETTSSYTVVEGPDLNGSASASSLAITKLEISSKNIRTLVDKAADEGLLLIKSPKVGFFRTSRTIKGKRAPPPCKEKQTVKEGQVVCYIEQLGGELPVESDISGEVIKILREDGDPVGYNDPLIAILPSFPGIKKLQ